MRIERIVDRGAKRSSNASVGAQYLGFVWSALGWWCWQRCISTADGPRAGSHHPHHHTQQLIAQLPGTALTDQPGSLSRHCCVGG